MVRQRGRSKLYWVLPITFSVLLLTAISLLTIYLDTQFHTAGFITAGIMASIGFHYFSNGNTAHACAASLENETLAEYGYYMVQNGIYVNIGAGGVFLASVFWFLLSEVTEPSTFWWYLLFSRRLGMPPEMIMAGHFWALRIFLIGATLIFTVGFLRHSLYSHWYTIIWDEIGASGDYASLIDKTIEKIRGKETEKKRTITVKEKGDVRISAIDASNAVKPGETYSISITVENDGRHETTRVLECEFNGEVVHTEEKTVEAGGTATVEFDHTAPAEEGEYEIRVDFGDA